MNTVKPTLQAAPPALPQGVGAVRAAASWFLDQNGLPRHGEVVLFAKDFCDHLTLLMPSVEQLAGERDRDDMRADEALAAVSQARRHSREPEAAGLAGEAARVKQLARCVVSLCDYYDVLTGITMCIVCDHTIEPGDTWTPYDHFRPSGGGLRVGRIHAACANKAARADR